MRFARRKDIYFLTVVLLSRICGIFNRPSLTRKVSKIVGQLAYTLSRQKRRASELSLEKVMGTRGKETREILKGSFRTFWEDLFGLNPSAAEWEELRSVRILGECNLLNAMKQGRGVILLESNTFGLRSAARQVLFTRGYEMVQIHAQNHLGNLLNAGKERSWVRKRLIYPFFERCEGHFTADIILIPGTGSLAYARGILRRLSQGAIVCSAGEGGLGERKVTVDLLGFPKAFATGMVSLSSICGVALLLLVAYRDESGRIVVRIGSPIQVPESCDRGKIHRQSLQLFADQLAALIRQHPDQYFGWHLLI